MTQPSVSRIAAALLMVCPIAACDSGTTEVPRVGFATGNAAAVSLIDSYLDASGTPLAGLSRSSSFVQNGSVTYDGAFVASLGGAGVVGDLSITVPIGEVTGALTGTASNIQNEVTGYYGGTLQGGGALDPKADADLPQLTLTLTGTLTDGTGSQTAALLLDGNFYGEGSDPEAIIAGRVNGAIGAAVLDDGLFAATN